MAQTLLDVQGLQTHFHTDGGVVKAVDGVDLTIEAGGILGLVGESGSGKSVTGLTIMRLLGTSRARVAGGRVLFKGRDLLALPDREIQALRGREIGMVFQGALTGLDPSFRVGSQMIEVIRRHQGVTTGQARQLALEALELVAMPDPERKLRSYSHELSGGQRQRVLIAMALSGKPDLLIADEPTTALDATVQKQIVDLLIEINRTLGTSILMVTHDFGVVARMCRTVAVMRHGRVVEQGTVNEVLTNPQHAYTESLMKAVPRLRLSDEERAVPRSERRLFELRAGGSPETTTAATQAKEIVHAGK